MSNHPHQPSHHHQPPPPPSCCSCCSSCLCPPPPPAISTSSTSDHLLHAIAAHLLLNSSPPPTPPPQPQSLPPPPAHHTNLYSYHYLKPHQNLQPNSQPKSEHHHLLLHSLLRRVAALESSVPHYFSSPPPPHPPRRITHRKPSFPSPPAAARAPSVQELAARTIQAYFRRFLARRSRTLRQLKHLAVLKSHAAALKVSASDRRGGDPIAISEAAMGLLLELDAIQGGDPMIREGKRAISRELTRILEFVDKVLVKEHEAMATRALEIGEDYGGCNDGVMVDSVAVNKKKVSFYGNGELYELHDVEEDNEVEESSERLSSAESDERKGGDRKKNVNEKLGLAAPMPVHMEPRRMAGERR